VPLKAWLTPEGEFADLSARAAARAASLGAAHASGARFLAVPVSDNRDAAEWALACFRSPVVFVPLPANLPAPALEKRLRQLPGGVVFPERLPAPPPGQAPALRPRGEIWAVIFSSGTTGEPKGVALAGAALEASARAHAAHSGVGHATWLLDLPLYHVGGLSVVTRALFLGAEIALGSPRFSAPATAAWLASGRVQGLSLVPTTLLRLLDEGADLARASVILLGGAGAPPELVERALRRGAPVRTTYGMTEHSSQIATERAGGEGLEPLPGVSLRVEDEEILVRSPMLASGYYRNGTLEPLPLKDGYFATGDLGEIGNGALEVKGRRSDAIVTGGKKVHPLEVEAELARLEGVEDSAVIGIPDPEWGEAVCAAVVTKGSFEENDAKNALRATLERHQVPKRWARLASIPRSPSGKVLRSELREAVERALKPSRS
jgi:O-succinylbenzoic acid--CoA ligase